MLLEVFAILFVQVNLIGKNDRRKKTKPLLIFLYVQLEICTFVVGFPTMMIYKGISLTNGYSYLCTELHLSLGFASYYGTNVRLEYANDAVLY